MEGANTMQGRRTRLLAVVGAALCATAVGAPGASAGERPVPEGAGAEAPEGAIVTEMRVTDVDREVAESRGFTVRTRADGTEWVDRGGDARPLDEVEYGDCGSSWVFIDPQGDYWSTIRTGFAVDDLVLTYYWKVNRTDPYGGTTNTWGGALGDYTWQGSWNIHGGGPGYETASVTPSSSVLLWDGSVCTSMAPSDTEYVY
jgi:hypothetical protein